VKFENIMKRNLKITVLWNARLPTLTSRYQRFKTIFCLQLQGIKYLSCWNLLPTQTIKRHSTRRRPQT